MTILTSGASGLIGKKLRAFLTSRGDRVLQLVRRDPSGPEEIAWDPAKGQIDAARLEGVDVAIHLSGANIGDGRWTEARKRELRDSRVVSTDLLARTLAACTKKPRLLVSASATGYYGPRSDVVDERAPAGDDFLGRLCVEWEAAAGPARAAGIAVAHPRIAVVMDRQDGALRRMLPAFRLGAGATLGDGTAPLSWVALDDVVGAIAFAVDRGLGGPFNVSSPHPTTMGELARTLGRVLHRPVLLRLPGALLRVALGEMSDSMLAGAAAIPTRLTEAGYRFQWPNLVDALAHALAVDSAHERAKRAM
ncbi:MAG TPA: TIGR01777 family oxidoreductase [Polyangia bacterium]|nr:TIGR01777 family oxidoreductase [Polyangia bacterium]